MANKLRLERIFSNNTYTIGKLYLNGKYICDTIEDTDRKLSSNMTVDEIKKIKVQNKTAIPYGTYKVAMDVVSPSYSKVDYYVKNYGAKIPRLLNVKGFEGVLIHPGNTEKDSAGCIIVGSNKVKGKVINSRAIFDKLYKLIKGKNDLTIEIIKKY